MILELVELVYQAAGDPAGWGAVVHRMAQALNGTAGTVHHHQLPSQASNFSTSWNVDPDGIDQYTAYYGLRNIWRTNRPELLETGRVNTSQVLCPEDVFERSEYYNDFMKRQGYFHCIVATLQNDETTESNLTIFRPKSAPQFGDEELGLLNILMPHLLKAFQLHNRIQGLETKASAAEQALDRMPSGIILLDARGRILFMNRMADSLFRDQKYFRLTASGIRAVRPSEDRLLARLIQGALAAGTSVGMRPGGIMKVARDMRRPMQLLVLPLRTRSLCLGGRFPAAMVFVADPEQASHVPAEWLGNLYGLTRAELHLAMLLVAGRDLKESAEQLQVSVSTVRSQLKSIFGKTDTHRQSELMRVLLLGAAHLLPDPVSVLSGIAR